MDNSSRVAHKVPARPVVTKRSPFKTAEQPNSRTATRCARQRLARPADQPLVFDHYTRWADMSGVGQGAHQGRRRPLVRFYTGVNFLD